MKPFNLTVAAKTDLRDIALFPERRWGKEQRNIYLKQFDDSFWLLAENPYIGKTCDDIRIGYRKFPQGSYIIFYQQIGVRRQLSWPVRVNYDGRLGFRILSGSSLF